MRVLCIILFALLYGHTGILSQKPILTLNSEHTGIVNDIAFSKEGKYLVSGGDDNLVKLWETGSQKCIRTFLGQGSEVLSVSISGEGKIIASGGIQAIHIWNAETGAIVKTLQAHTGRVVALLFSPDDKWLISGGHDGRIVFWDAASGNKLREIKRTDGQYIRSIALSPNGRQLLCGSGYARNKGEISLWDAETAMLIAKIDTAGNEVMSVAFSPDGNSLLSADCMGKIKQWDVQTGALTKTIDGKFGSLLAGMAVSPDGKMVAVCDSWASTIKVFNIATGVCTQTHKTSETIRVLKFSPDGFIMAGNAGMRVTLRNADRIGETAMLGRNLLTTGELYFSTDGKYLFSGNKKWNTQTGQLIMSYAQKPRHNGFSKNDSTFLTIHDNNNISIWHQPSGKRIKTIQSPNDYVYAAVFSANGKQIISADNKSAAIILVWDIGSGKTVKTLLGPDASIYITHLCMSDDGKRLLIMANTNGEWHMQVSLVKILDLATGKITNLNLKHSKGSNGYAAFSKDGSQILTFIGGNLQTYDAQSGQPLLSFADKRAAKATCATFSHDAKWVAAGMDYAYGGSHQYYINLYASGSENPVKTLGIHHTQITGIVFTQNGKQLVTTAADQSVKYWDVETGAELVTLYTLTTNDFVAITPEGLFDGTPEGIKYLYYVKGMEVLPLESMFEGYFTPKLFAGIMQDERVSPQVTSIASLKLVPEIKLISPEMQTRGIQVKPATTDEQTVKITIAVTDKGGGIDEVVLFQNGKLVQTTHTAFKNPELVNEQRTVTFTIPLVKGINRFKAVAFSNQRTESAPVEFSVNAGEPQVKKPVLHLIAIGINAYKNNRYNLNYAVSDAQGIVNSLAQAQQSLFSTVHAVFIANEDATKERIGAEIRRVAEKALPEDIFIFYFGGHGVITEDSNPLFYLIPHDITQMYNGALLHEKAISAAELKAFSVAIKAQKQLFILDACQSGGIGNMVAARGATEEKAIAQLARSTGTYWLAASNSNQFAGEFAQLGHGVFTYAVLQGLSGKADGQADKIITVQELSAYISDQVPQLSKAHKGLEQYPVTYGFGNDFPILLLR